MVKKNDGIDIRGELDYSAALAELEKIAAAVEDPATGIGDVDKYMARAETLVASCRAFLRKSREKVERLDSTLQGAED